jgi:hypothetical protein
MLRYAINCSDAEVEKQPNRASSTLSALCFSSKRPFAETHHMQQQSEGLQLHAFCAEPSMPAAPLPQRRRKRTKTHIQAILCREMHAKAIERGLRHFCVKVTEELTTSGLGTDRHTNLRYILHIL